jgi:hypothetical protein
MVVDYKLQQVVASITAAELDVVSLLKQTNTASGTKYVAIDLVNMFFSTPHQ